MILKYKVPLEKEEKDITDYVQHVTWSGDSEQSARKLDFSIAYNTPEKDRVFIPLDLKLGGVISVFEDGMNIFKGRIFYRKRASEGYSFEFTCFDDAIYLAKSNIRAIISGTVPAAIKQVCNEVEIQVGDMPEMNASVNFIADDRSCSEVIRMILDYQSAADGNQYLPVCINGKLNIVKKGELIEDYIATADTNIMTAEHSESIEDMVNRIKAVDDSGNVMQIFSNDDDVKSYGILQQIYKMQPAKPGETVDNVKAAKAKLKKQKDESSLKGIGNIQCITGWAITVKEEQLKGTFYIKSDTHEFENGNHTMTLTLEYMEET